MHTSVYFWCLLELHFSCFSQSQGSCKIKMYLICTHWIQCKPPKLFIFIMTSVKEFCCCTMFAHSRVIIQMCVKDNEILPYKEFNDFSFVKCSFWIWFTNKLSIKKGLSSSLTDKHMLSVCDDDLVSYWLINLTNRIVFLPVKPGFKYNFKM